MLVVRHCEERSRKVVDLEAGRPYWSDDRREAVQGGLPDDFGLQRSGHALQTHRLLDVAVDRVYVRESGGHRLGDVIVPRYRSKKFGIVRELVSPYGGSLWLLSAPSGGCEWKCNCPAVDPQLTRTLLDFEQP